MNLAAPTFTAKINAPTTDGITETNIVLPAPPPGYELLDRLGSGGMGMVYLARDQAQDRLVAMKYLHHPGSSNLFERFLVELRVLAQLEHPNIVRVLSSDFLRANPYYTMEYLPQGSLAQLLSRKEPVPIDAAVRFMRAIADALNSAHTQKVIHRDLKPSNILLYNPSANGHHHAESGKHTEKFNISEAIPKVADFGLAKRLEQDDHLTNASGALGTASYMPPEQISRKNGEIGPWSDVYGLGATIYHVLTGRTPFTAMTSEETIRLVLLGPPIRPRAYRPEIPAALEGIVLKCLEKDPAVRYQSMADLIADLDRFLAGQKPFAPTLTPLRRARQWARQRRPALTITLLLFVLTAGAFGLAAAYWPKQEQSVPPDADLAKANRLKAINNDLIAGKRVELVGQSGEPLWYDVPAGALALGNNPTRTANEPGGCFFSANGLTVLKLLDPPIDRYVVELEMQHVNGKPSLQPSLGFFVGYSTMPRPDDWSEHALLSIGYHDLDRTDLNKPPTPSGVEFTSYCFAAHPGRLLGMHRMRISEEVPLAAEKFFPGKWRKLIIDVSPERIVATWHPEPGKVETVANFTAAEIRDFRRHHDVALVAVGQEIDHVFAPLPPWSPRGGIGIWARNADVAFKNVVITPR